MITAALAFLHARRGLLEVLLAVGVVAALWLAYDRRIDAAVAQGMQRQQVADDLAKADLQKQVDALTAQNLVLARAAKAKYDSDHAQNTAAATQPVDTSQLCKPTSAHGSSSGLPQAGRSDVGNAAGTASAPVVREVPSPDNGIADDRRRLLAAIAALSDDDSAVIREFQERQAVK
jgi:hypothetical protein